ncbi:hypothetical protein FA95DRAFT_587717 [Auriscalpium vulgare]|uniref:Uncharacterized protein n=1 Tax=Auriscalpium vulgare TaxID=40419 RepID=A0ACB8REH8_9AGAM|nr:hypothetical protein FA95DRAFT_587717 [Auriscalpium vulgare]
MSRRLCWKATADYAGRRCNGPDPAAFELAPPTRYRRARCPRQRQDDINVALSLLQCLPRTPDSYGILTLISAHCGLPGCIATPIARATRRQLPSSRVTSASFPPRQSTSHFTSHTGTLFSCYDSTGRLPLRTGWSLYARAIYATHSRLSQA